MNQAMAATLIVSGLIAITWAVMMWVKKYREEQRHSKAATFLMAAGGIALGTGLGALTDINVLQDKVGYFPLWLIFVAVFGFLFLLEMKGWKDHHVRTPVLAAATMLVLFAAVGHGLVSYATHTAHSIQTTSTVRPAPKGKG